MNFKTYNTQNNIYMNDILFSYKQFKIQYFLNVDNWIFTSYEGNNRFKIPKLLYDV